MKTFLFKSAHFFLAALESKDLPKPSLPEIAIAGRSNVGKSSLLNHLFNKKGLAKTSSTPGKTRTLNFFQVDNSLIFVDLPGYGFARISKETQAVFSSAVDDYLSSRTTLSLLLLLLDVRHPIREDDFALIDWANEKKLPLLVIFTKTDKLKSSELQKVIKKNVLLPATQIYYSIHDPNSRKDLMKKIEQLLS